MADFCAPLKREDPNAFTGCLQLKKMGYTFDQLNRGVTRLHYIPGNEPIRIPDGTGDDKLSPAEIYNPLAQLAENEQMRLAHRLLKDKNLLFPHSFKFPHHEFLKNQVKTIHPAIFDLSDPKQADLFKIVIKKIQTIQKEMLTKKLNVGSEGYVRHFSQALFKFIQAEKESGGLGITFSNNNRRAIRNFSELFEAGVATCIEFVNLFVALGRIANLPVVPLEVLKNEKGEAIQHDFIGVRLDPKNKKKMLFFDIQTGFQGKKAKDIYSEIGRLELMSRYYNSQIFLTPNSAAPILKNLKKSLQLTPSDYLINTNFARVLIVTNGPVEQILSSLFKVHQSYKNYPYFFLGLSELFEAQGDKNTSRTAKKISEKLNNPSSSDSSE